MTTPGDVSQPEGDGPVTLSDRTEPGGQGSPDTNQGKTEPMSAQPDHPEPLAAPDLDTMSAGAAGSAQAPSHPAAAATRAACTFTYETRCSGHGPCACRAAVCSGVA